MNMDKNTVIGDAFLSEIISNPISSTNNKSPEDIKADKVAQELASYRKMEASDIYKGIEILKNIEGSKFKDMHGRSYHCQPDFYRIMFEDMRISSNSDYSEGSGSPKGAKAVNTLTKLFGMLGGRQGREVYCPLVVEVEHLGNIRLRHKGWYSDDHPACTVADDSKTIFLECKNDQEGVAKIIKYITSVAIDRGFIPVVSKLNKGVNPVISNVSS